MDKCEICQNYMCQEIGSPFLRDQYRGRCKFLGYKLFIPPKKEEQESNDD